ncbi:unnamed protein product [Amoebophrya sp. A25]|nr:unnamed protein product [Amoebophrya sp. A25]|eukprot:GSA25T00024562001.1
MRRLALNASSVLGLVLLLPSWVYSRLEEERQERPLRVAQDAGDEYARVGPTERRASSLAEVRSQRVNDDSSSSGDASRIETQTSSTQDDAFDSSFDADGDTTTIDEDEDFGSEDYAGEGAEERFQENASDRRKHGTRASSARSTSQSEGATMRREEDDGIEGDGDRRTSGDVQQPHRRRHGMRNPIFAGNDEKSTFGILSGPMQEAKNAAHSAYRKIRRFARRMLQSAGAADETIGPKTLLMRTGGARSGGGHATSGKSDSKTSSDGDGSFAVGFRSALGMIFATEIGDRTFFIAAIMAMSNSRLLVFGGAIGALAVMTVLSSILGHALPQLLPKVLTHWASIALLIYFGTKMLWEARQMYLTGEGATVSEELEEVESELVEKGLAAELADTKGKRSNELKGLNDDPEFGLGMAPDSDACASEVSTAGTMRAEAISPREISMDAPHGGTSFSSPEDRVTQKAMAEDASTVASSSGREMYREQSANILSADGSTATGRPSPLQVQQQHLSVLTQAFTLTFLAEWGDRSQIATIALAAAQNPYGVTVGAIIGHAMCTGLAVIGGKILATSITERQVALSGGVLFYVFALYSIWMGVQD